MTYLNLGLLPESPEQAAAFTDGPFGRALWLQADGMALPQGPGGTATLPRPDGGGAFWLFAPFRQSALAWCVSCPRHPAGGVSCYAFGPWGEPVCTPAPSPRLNPAFAKIRGRGLGVSLHTSLYYRPPLRYSLRSWGEFANHSFFVRKGQNKRARGNVPLRKQRQMRVGMETCPYKGKIWARASPFFSRVLSPKQKPYSTKPPHPLA